MKQTWQRFHDLPIFLAITILGGNAARREICAPKLRNNMELLEFLGEVGRFGKNFFQVVGGISPNSGMQRCVGRLLPGNCEGWEVGDFVHHFRG